MVLERFRVYVAGPISKGDRYWNIHNGIITGRKLVELGFAPLIPHLTHFADPSDSLTWEAWLQVDEAWIAHADAVYRMEGESAGANRECAFAKEHHVPVCHTMEELLNLREMVTNGVG